MLITATQKFTRQSPRKIRLVANAVKKMPLDKALQQLALIERRSTLVLMKTLKQAIANAVNNHHVSFKDLSIDTILVNEGPRFRRMRAVSRGRGHEIIKRTSHVVVRLNVADGSVAAKPMTQALANAEAKTVAAETSEATVAPVKAVKPAKTAAAKTTKPKTTKTTKEVLK